MKVVDRKAHSPVHEYLSSAYSNPPFDAVIDAVGVQSIYDHSPKYLSDQGRFVSVGVMSKDLSVASVIQSVLKIGSNLYWPRLLGGVSRPYLQKTASVDLTSLEELRALVEDGKLRVVVDSCFSIADAKKVRTPDVDNPMARATLTYLVGIRQDVIAQSCWKGCC